jgi:hypothetical protein
MARMSRDPLGEDVNVGTGDLAADSLVEIRKTADGRAVMLPRSPNRRNLNGEALEVLADLQGVVRDLAKLRDELDELVQEARETGAPWVLIGFSVGMGDEAARKRWSGSD